MRSARRLLGSIALGVLLGALGAAASGEGPTRPRLVLLYATCTLNKRFLSPYGADPGTTPNLAAFARRARVFRAHRTESGLSGVAFASLFTGTQADQHGVFTHPTPLSDSLYLITEAFADHGYDVFFWGDHGMASARLNYAQGVAPENRFGAPRRVAPPDPRRAQPEREGFLKAGDPVLAGVLARLRSDADARAFLLTNFTVTHAPYSAAYVAEWDDESRRYAELLWEHYVDLSWNFAETATKLGLTDSDVERLAETAERLYRSNVKRLDRLFGELLAEIEAAGLREETLVVFTADHGEVLYREGAPLVWNHGFALDSEVLDVPLLIGGPGVVPGSYEAVTRSIDVFPTVAALSGISLEGRGVAGSDLSAVLRGEAAEPQLSAFSHTALVPEALLRSSRKRGGTRLEALQPRPDPALLWVGLRDADRIVELTVEDGATRRAAYDAAADPVRRENRFDPEDPRDRDAARRLEEYKAGLVARHAQTVPSGDDPSARTTQELLRALGYLD